jgi:hypothetical protein
LNLIPWFNKIPYFMDAPERRVWVKAGPKTGSLYK